MLQSQFCLIVIFNIYFPLDSIYTTNIFSFLRFNFSESLILVCLFYTVGGTWKFANLEIFIFLVNFSLEITVYALKSILSDSNIQHLLSFG